MGLGQVGVRPAGTSEICFLGLGRSELPRGAWERRGLAGDWTWGREAEPLQLCVESARTRGSGSGAPNLLGSVLAGPFSSVSGLAEPSAVRPTPISLITGSPRLSWDFSGTDSALRESAEKPWSLSARRGCVLV